MVEPPADVTSTTRVTVHVGPTAKGTGFEHVTMPPSTPQVASATSDVDERWPSPAGRSSTMVTVPRVGLGPRLVTVIS